MGATGTRTVLLASPSLEAPTPEHATGARRADVNESRASRALRSDPRTWFGAGVVTLLILLAIAAPVVARYDPVHIDLINQLSPPSTAHWLGTDIQGRDVWARLVY